MSTPEPPPYPSGDNEGEPPTDAPGYPPPAPGYPPPPPGAPPQYGAAPQYGAPASPPGSSKATTSLVTGIIGILCCGLLGIVAIVTGKQATAEAAAVGYAQPGNAKAGIVLGWIAIGLMIVGLLVWILLFALGIAGSFETTTY